MCYFNCIEVDDFRRFALYPRQILDKHTFGDKQQTLQSALEFIWPGSAGSGSAAEILILTYFQLLKEQCSNRMRSKEGFKDEGYQLCSHPGIEPDSCRNFNPPLLPHIQEPPTFGNPSNFGDRCAPILKHLPTSTHPCNDISQRMLFQIAKKI